MGVIELSGELSGRVSGSGFERVAGAVPGQQNEGFG